MATAMRILLVHQSYPGQFQHLEKVLVARGDSLTAIGRETTPAGDPAVRRCGYRYTRGNTPGLPPLLLELETKVLRAGWAAELAEGLRADGYQPDLILAHPGWGEALFLGDVWPEVPQLHYLEFDYQAGVDMHFDPEFPIPGTWQERARARMKAANTQLNLAAMTWGLTPTRFQWSTLPAGQRGRVSVIHDGIDLERLGPDPVASLQLPDGTSLGGPDADPVLTMVNRTFEPYRGIHRLMRALPELQRRHPRLQVLLIGRDSPQVSYGPNRDDGRGWLAALREELGDQLDWSRIHAPGKLAYHQFVQAMQLSAAHVYFTYPFVLSWSLLEAMACGALVIGSATAPVQEVIEHGRNGLLVDFFDQEALVEAVSHTISQPGRYKTLRQAARRTVEERYELKTCLRRQLALIDAVASGVIGAEP